MRVNGREWTGHATTYVSKKLTDKFWHLDRIMFSMSPFLTDEESWQLLTEAEIRAESELETNWTAGDCLQFCRDILGEDRWRALEMAWEINSQNAVLQLYAPEELREAWVHKLSMTEGTPEQVRTTPGDYVLIQTTRDKERKLIM